MRIEKRDSKDEKRVLIGMIVDRAVLGAIAVKWKSVSFRSKWANLVGGWCVDFYNRYEEAPGPSIQGLYEAWASDAKDDATVQLVEKFLETLSDEYETLKEESNSDFVLDIAKRHFEKVRIEKLQEELKGDLDAGDIERANKRLEKSSRIELGVGAGVDIFLDPQAVQAAFEAKGDPLIRYKGAIGEFYGDSLERDALVAILAAEKRGKCVSEDMEIMLANGEVYTIREIVERQITVPVLTLNEKWNRFQMAIPSQFWKNGKKECWEVTTKTGRRVVTTGNHQYLTPSGWKLLEDIQKGDFIAVPKRIPFFGNTPMEEAEIKFIAYMLAEGCCVCSPATFTNTDPELISDFEQCCQSLNLRQVRRGISNVIYKSTPILKKYGLYGHKSTEKVIPKAIFKLPKSQVALFLRIFFSCDGWISPSRGNLIVGLCLASEKLIRQISHLLNRFGIVHKVTQSSAKCEGKVFPCWSIGIKDDENVSLFLKEINFISYKRKEIFEPKHLKSFLDRVPPEISRKIVEESGGFPGARSVLSNARSGRPTMRKSFVGLDNNLVRQKYLDSDVLWDEVTEIRHVGKKMTYDLGIPITHNFVANDCVVHNTWEMIDLAYTAMEQRRKVAFFEIGDLTQHQLIRRMAIRACRRPLKPKTVWYPTSIERDPEEEDKVHVEREEKVFEGELAWQEALRRMAKIQQKKLRSDESYFRLSCHPTFSVNIQQIENILQSWERHDWVPDVVIIDYADNLAPPYGSGEGRDAINETWGRMRGLSQSWHNLVITATQATRASYSAKVVTREHPSEDKRKLAHATAMVGINTTHDEKTKGVSRRNWVVLREEEFFEEKCVYVAGCLAVGRPIILSTW